MSPQIRGRRISTGNAGRGLVGRVVILSSALVLAACGGEETSSPTPDPEPLVGVQVVVSSHALATDAGIAVLQAGGSAADAAVAVAATLSVVEPWFSSVLGGGTWALYYDAATGRVTSLDGVGPVGSKASVADYAARLFESGMHQANVPGAWDGWMLWLDRFGRLSLGEVLAPAIAIARQGYAVNPAMALWLVREVPVIANWPPSARIYAPNGALLRTGDTVYQHDIAETFEALVAAFDSALDQGRSAAVQAARDYFYRGPLADAIVLYSDSFGGYLTSADFHSFQAEIVDPIAIDYRDGIRVYQNPPNSQGITMLIALNILKGFDFSGLSPDDADAIHLQLEALKLAFTDRYFHVGDPERVTVPVQTLLSELHAQRQRERIDPGSALVWPIEDGLAGDFGAQAARDFPFSGPYPEPATGTTTFHVLDRDGNAAAVTTSLGAQFLVIGDTGIHINNRMRFLGLQQGDPNLLTPGSKVRHTSNPYMALRHGRPFMLGGNTGADSQVQGQVQQFISHVEFGLSAQEAIGRPRFLTTAFPSTTPPFLYGNTVQLETGFSAGLADQLSARGHTVRVGAGVFGSAHMVVIDEDRQGADVGVERRSSISSGRVLPPGE